MSSNKWDAFPDRRSRGLEPSQQALRETVRMPKPPITAKLFPVFMMMGIMILMASLIIGIVLAAPPSLTRPNSPSAKG